MKKMTLAKANTTKCHAHNIILLLPFTTFIINYPLLPRREFIFIRYDQNLFVFFHMLYVKKS